MSEECGEDHVQESMVSEGTIPPNPTGISDPSTRTDRSVTVRSLYHCTRKVLIS